MSNKNINQGRFVTNRINTNFFRNLAIFVFIIKVFICLSITPLINWKFQGHMWLGADGENYLIGVNALSRDGFFSNQEILNYWPAGYPIFIYFFGIFGTSNALTILGLFQSAIFSYAVYLISIELFRNRFRRLSKILCIFLLFNPTLSLNSLSIGYESLCASGFLIATSLTLKYFRTQEIKLKIRLLFIIGLILSFISSFQPRLIISGILITSIIFFSRKDFFKSLLPVAGLVFIIALLPASLIVRNHFASGLNVLSLNLGVTMSIGAGDDATGAYRASWKGVPCKYNEADRVEADSAQIRCVLNWYLENPKKSLRLFLNKSKYYWSPWIGPETRGTMARNPWSQTNPLNNIAQTEQGFNLVYGAFGKFVSWLWVITSFCLMLTGLIRLLSSSGLPRQLGLINGAIIFPSWLITLLTLGDNRFRLPTMGSVITLQIIGMLYTWRKVTRKKLDLDVF